MTWKRVTPLLDRSVEANKIIEDRVRRIMFSRQQFNTYPIIQYKTVRNQGDVNAALDEMAATVAAFQAPFRSSFWLKQNRREVNQPVLISRTWVQAFPLDQYYWLTLFRIYDQQTDMAEILQPELARSPRFH